MRRAGIVIVLALAAAVLVFAWWPLAHPVMIDTQAIPADEDAFHSQSRGDQGILPASYAPIVPHKHWRLELLAEQV